MRSYNVHLFHWSGTGTDEEQKMTPTLDYISCLILVVIRAINYLSSHDKTIWIWVMVKFPPQKQHYFIMQNEVNDKWRNTQIWLI